MFECVCVCVCVRMCERERERVCESGFVFKIAPQSTAVQKDEAPKPWALLGYPQCSARWLIHPSQQRWKWEENGWFECFPLTFFFFFYLFPPAISPSCVPKGKTKKQKQYFCVDDRKLYCDMSSSWLWETTRLYLSVFAQEREKIREVQYGRLGIVMRRERKRERVQAKSSENYMKYL